MYCYKLLSVLIVFWVYFYVMIHGVEKPRVEKRLEKPEDTFLDMRKWGKGIVFVNGHNLGRYWEIGPQQTLYLPGVWLKEGKNTVVVYEQLENKKTTLSSIDHPILDELNL